MNDYHANGKSAVQHLTMMFGVVAGALSIILVIVGAAWYGGTVSSTINHHNTQLEQLEFRVKVLENKVSKGG